MYFILLPNFGEFISYVGSRINKHMNKICLILVGDELFRDCSAFALSLVTILYMNLLLPFKQELHPWFLRKGPQLLAIQFET